MSAGTLSAPPELGEAPKPDRPQKPVARLAVAPCCVADVLRLERELGVTNPVAQVLVRRGLGDPARAREWLAADEAHDASRFEGIHDAVGLILRHVESGSAITIHGDYDVDGVCSTAILVRVLRRLDAQVDFYLPSRTEDGYGLNPQTVQRLAAKGTRLLITADCAITAVEEVAAARAAGMDVVVTDHHTPRADGLLPDAPIVHPALCGYPCVDLCAAGVAYKLAGALLAGAGQDPALADEDLDLVALATVADVVALRGENRRLVRAGLKVLAGTKKVGLRALMKVSKCDPSRLDSSALGFRLAPRINAAGRLYRADAGLELVLTEDAARAEEVADELDRVNHERRHTEQRILFAAEAQVAEQGEQPAYVLHGEDWHPGVVGIVASRIAERYHRPCVLIAMDGDRGTGSGRSVAGFDLLGALNASAEHLQRHGGHRAAAGLEIAREDLEAFRAAFCAHTDVALTPDLREPVERVDAVVAGDELGLALAEDLQRLAPFGQGNPAVSLLVPAARLTDPRPMGENRHVRFTVEAGDVRARAVAFGTAGKIPCDTEGPVDATFTLEINEWQGAVEPRLVLRCARPCEPGAIEIVGDEPFLDAALTEAAAALHPTVGDAVPGHPKVRDRRGGGLAGTIQSLVASGESVLVVAAHSALRRRHLADRLGGFALTSHAALERDPILATRYAHVVVLDPPAAASTAVVPGPTVHLAWGRPEVDFAVSIHERERDLRAPLTAIYRALRDRGGAAGEELEAALREGDPQRTPAQAGRALRVLAELGLVHLDPDRRSVAVPAAERTSLDLSEAFRAYSARSEDGRRFLTSSSTTAARTATAAA